MTRRVTHTFVARVVVAIVLASITTIDAQRTVEGAGEIAGTVVTTGAAPRPLARVLVTVSGPALKTSQTVITDDLGRFAFRNLPTGRFTVIASRPPYVKTSYGAKRPGRPGTPIDLAAGQHLANITIPLARGAAITGVVRSPAGEPMPGVVVGVTPLDVQLDSPGNPVVTDDRGVYRAFGLVPGRYVVRAGGTDRTATSVSQFTDAEMDAILAKLRQRPSSAAPQTPQPGAATSAPPATAAAAAFSFAPIYFPGTTDPDAAETLTLAEGEERSGVDIDIQLVRISSVAGRVMTPDGAMPGSITLTLNRVSQRRLETENFIMPSAANLDATGRFRFQNVVPGRYRVAARAMPASAAAGVMWAAADVTVGVDDVSNVALTLQAGLRLSGRLVFDARAMTPPDLSSIRLRLVEVNGATSWVPTGAGRAGGEFDIPGILPGAYTMASPVTESGWLLRSVVVGGRDIMDVPLEIGATGDVTGAVVTFTDKHTELSGVLQTAANIPAPDYFIVVVSADRTFWRPGARRVQFARPSTDGRFVLRDLPAGDYVIAAVTDMDASDLADASFMASLVGSGVKVTLGEGETKTQDLKIGGSAPAPPRPVR